METFKVGDKVRLNTKYYFDKESKPKLLGLSFTDINELIEFEGIVKITDYDNTCDVDFEKLNVRYFFYNDGLFKI